MRINISVFYLWFFALLFASNVHAVEFSLFGDTTFIKSEDGSRFNLGSIDLTADQNISNNTFVTTEFLFEYEDNGYITEVSRFSINREITDDIEVYAGKFSNGLGVWHQTFHHGSMALDTVSLPFFIGEADGLHGIIPTHMVGIGMTGHLGSLEYQLAVVNNPGINTEEGSIGDLTVHSNDRDAPGDKFGTVFKLSYEINWKTRFGLMSQTRKITEHSTANVNIDVGDSLFDQQQLGIDFMYAGNKFSTYMEYYQLTTEDNSDFSATALGETVNTNADSYDATMFYLQMGWRFNDQLSFSARHEALDYDSGNTFFNLIGVDKQTRNIISVNYRLDESNAIRLEGKQIKFDSDDTLVEDDTVYTLQWFFLLL